MMNIIPVENIYIKATIKQPQSMLSKVDMIFKVSNDLSRE